MNKKLVISSVLVVSVLIIAAALAQSPPELINYQGRLLDSAGQPLDGETVELTFSFSSALSGGTLFLTVEQDDVLVSGGVYNVLIGSGTITPGTESGLAELFQKHGEVWMGVQVGADQEMTPRARISSVPYSLTALTVNASYLDQFINAHDYDGDGREQLLYGGTDCDDGNPAVYPGAPELCDGIDNQCPGDPGYGGWWTRDATA